MQGDISFEEEKEETPPWIVLPTNKYRVRWDVLMMFLVLYYAVVTPLSMAFTTPLDDMLVFDLSLNSLFIIGKTDTITHLQPQYPSRRQ